jgi:hypothetical protein
MWAKKFFVHVLGKDKKTSKAKVVQNNAYHENLTMLLYL